MKSIKLKDLKKGEWFTRKPIAEPKESEVFIKDDYDREVKKYLVTKWADISSSKLLKGETIVYTGFTF